MEDELTPYTFRAYAMAETPPTRPEWAWVEWMGRVTLLLDWFAKGEQPCEDPWR